MKLKLSFLIFIYEALIKYIENEDDRGFLLPIFFVRWDK